MDHGKRGRTRTTSAEEGTLVSSSTSGTVPDMVARAEEFLPLQNLRVTGRVRARQAPTVGNPILDVVEIEEIQ